MILDQQIGAHAAQVEYIGLGWGASWVSGFGDTTEASLVGQWSNVIDCPSVNRRIECVSVNRRIDECQR